MFKNDSLSIFIRLCLSVVGTSIIALGIVFFRLSSLGIDPATAADIGISNTFNWYLGKRLAFLYISTCIWWTIWNWNIYYSIHDRILRTKLAFLF